MLNFSHKSIMVSEVLANLGLCSPGRFLDGTVGGGGHASAILTASSPAGEVFGCDRDAEAIEAARATLSAFPGRFQLRQMPFSQVNEWLEPASCDGALLDLGVSSHQLDSAHRGFSFQNDGPLSMRMDSTQKLSAENVINEYPAEELARIFWQYGDERHSRKIARVIEEERRMRRITTTKHLAQIIERIIPRGEQRIHPATRVFQALRIEVNDELGQLSEGLEAVWEVLKPGARLAILTFHSLEDRLVKEFGQRGARDYEYPGEEDIPELRTPRAPRLKLVTRKPLSPSEEEIRENSRARSARLRVFQKM